MIFQEEMHREFQCYKCGEPAFTTTTGVNYHGTQDKIDCDTDANHIALDPAFIDGGLGATSGRSRRGR